MPWFWKGGEKRSFSVLIYEGDYKELCAWVLRKPNIETGGDLFGLWADKHTAVIQLVLGPGKRCTRTTTSFYQDIDYLRRVGSYLTQNEGVCHIGEWHSHHQLGLARPSGGDENTVWNNMPTYNLKRFVIFIANIQSSKQSYNVDVGCFLFEIDDEGKHMDVLPGKFTILQKNSPLSGKTEVTEKRNKGAEKDDENKIAIKELKMEMEGGKSPSSVSYLKPMTSPKSEPRKRAGNRSNHPQPANQNKPSDEESSVDNKKRKMNPEEGSPNKSSGTGKKSPEGSPPNEDMKNLTINNEQQQQEEESEEAMELEKEKEQPEKNSEEEFTHEEQHDSERGKSPGKKAGNIKENDEAGPPQAEQGETEKEGKPRPLPQLAETTPEKPAETTPEKPVETTPEKPAETTPEKPAETTPEKPAETTPEKPAETTPEKPAETTPEKPAETTPKAETQKQKKEEEQTANRSAVQSGTRTEEKSESKDHPPQVPTVEGNKKKLEIKIAAIKTPCAKKAGSSRTGPRKSPTGSLPGEDVNKLTTNDEQPEEKSKEAMKEQEAERQEKKNQEEIRRNEQHDKEKGKSQETKGENLEKGKEAGAPQTEQKKAEKKNKPKLGEGAPPGAKTQKKKEQGKETAKTRAVPQGGPKKGGSSTKGSKKQK